LPILPAVADVAPVVCRDGGTGEEANEQQAKADRGVGESMTAATFVALVDCVNDVGQPEDGNARDDEQLDDDGVCKGGR